MEFNEGRSNCLRLMTQVVLMHPMDLHIKGMIFKVIVCLLSCSNNNVYLPSKPSRLDKPKEVFKI